MDKSKLEQESRELIDQFLNTQFHNMKPEDVNAKDTLVLVVDMINGFAKEGSLYSERVKKLISNQVKVLERLDQVTLRFICDGHPQDATEFDVFPSHCVLGSEESEIVRELKPFVKDDIIYKNSTNGYLEDSFQELIKENFNQVIIIGCCTDLCILQLALTLKTHYNRLNKKIPLNIPTNLVDTYHLDATNHPGDFMHLIALKMMQDNGIRLVEMDV
ncbi:MAG: cysteine hydrolase [Clostridia bacterium]|nr:cysteine hydrolase [Clostridia bacterium]